MKLTYGSVCSGIEAASVAWEPLGLLPAWFSQFDPEHDYNKGPDFPSAVLAHHWPHVPNLGDMTKIAYMLRCGAVSAPDILVGGTPCQAFSVAGMRKGLDDTRGQLTIKFVEIADEIDRQRGAGNECVILWENVPGVLSSKDNAFGCFLAGLVGEDCELVPPGGKWSNAGCVFGPKRTAVWRILDAQYFGVAQRRRRVFVVASARKDFDPTAVLFEREGVRRDTAPRHQQQPSEYSEHATIRAFDMLGFGQYGEGLTASTCKARDYKDATDLVVMPDGSVRRLTPTECERLQGFPEYEINTTISVINADIGTALCSDHQNKSAPAETKNHKSLKYAQSAEDEKSTSNARCVAWNLTQGLAKLSERAVVSVQIDLERMRLHIRRAERLILSASIADSQSRCLLRIPAEDFALVAAHIMRQAVKATATGRAGSVENEINFSHQEIGKFRSRLYGQEIRGLASNAELFTHQVRGHLKCITSQAGPSSEHSEQMLAISSFFVATAISGFIPEEIQSSDSYELRLTISAGHTAIPYRNKPAADGHRYKALGNSMAVPVIAWLGKRIIKELTNGL